MYVKAVVRVLFIGLVIVFAGLTSAHAEKAYWTLEAGLFSPEENAFDTGFSLQGSVGLSMAAIDPSLAQRDPIWSKVYLVITSYSIHYTKLYDEPLFHINSRGVDPWPG